MTKTTISMSITATFGALSADGQKVAYMGIKTNCIFLVS